MVSVSVDGKVFLTVVVIGVGWFCVCGGSQSIIFFGSVCCCGCWVVFRRVSLVVVCCRRRRIRPLEFFETSMSESKKK